MITTTFTRGETTSFGLGRRTAALAFVSALRFLPGAYGVAVLCYVLLAPARFLPAEDVMILHQCSRNLAQHGAITYYAGGPHAEGATDFGWMVLLAGAMRLGLSAVWFTAVVNAVSLVALSIALLRLARVPAGARRRPIAAPRQRCSAHVRGWAFLRTDRIGWPTTPGD